MIQTNQGIWLWSPYDPRPYASIENSPIRQLDITPVFWNMLWTLYPTVDMKANMIGMEEPVIVGMNSDWTVPAAFQDLRVAVRGEFFWSPDDLLQMLKFRPTIMLIKRIEWLANKYGVSYNHNLYDRVGLTSQNETFEQTEVQVDTLPANVVSFSQFKGKHDGKPGTQ